MNQEDKDRAFSGGEAGSGKRPSQQEPSAADSLLGLAMAHHDAGELDRAEALYRVVLQASPDHPDALGRLGMLACQLGQGAVALQLIDRAIAVGIVSAQLHFWRGNALYLLGEYEAAATSYASAVTLDPEHAEAYNNRASALHALQRYEEALASYDTAIALMPEYSEAYCNRGNTLYVLGRFRAAVESCDAAIRLRRDHPSAHYNRGNALHALELYREALESYDESIRLAPNNAKVHNNRGNALQALLHYEAAVESYSRAIELQPEYADALENHENAAQMLKQYQAILEEDDWGAAFRPDYRGKRSGEPAEVMRQAARLSKIANKLEIKAELDALPREVRLHPAICNIRKNNFVKTNASGRDLVFYCAAANEVWNPETAKTRGIGGSEESVVWLSQLLHQRGWNVTVYAHCGLEEKEYDGVVWKPHWMWNHRDRQNVTIVWRHPQFTKFEINSDKTILDLHDVIPEQEFTAERLARIDKIFVKSRFHRSLLPNVPDEKFAVIPNGIDTNLFLRNGERDPCLLINTSSADRSLEAFVDCFAEIRKRFPDAKAQWAYGWDVWNFINSARPELMRWKAVLQRRMKELGMQELGRVSHSEIAKLYHRANIFAYPSEMAEIDCISLSKAMAAGAIPVTTDFAAMGDKSSHGGVFIHSSKTRDNWALPGQFHFEITDPVQKAQFVEEVVKLLECPPSEESREAMRAWARQTFDWNTIADSWHEALS